MERKLNAIDVLPKIRAVRLRPPHRRFRRLLTAAFIVGIVWLFGVAGAIFLYGERDRARASDVIVVLGAGVRADNSPTFAQIRRTYQGFLLWQDGIAPNILCTGATSLRSTRSEAWACSQLLQEWGVPVSAIVLEENSRSTEENALFARAAMDENGWETATVVSDRYHLLRANWMFDRVGVEAYTSPVSFVRLRPDILVRSMAREIAALHWQVVKALLGLPVTQVPLV